MQEWGLWEDTATIRNLKWAWALLLKKVKALYLPPDKIRYRLSEIPKAGDNRSNTIYSVLWNTHCHIETHSSVFVGGSAGRVECGFYKFWLNFSMFCEVIYGLRHFKSLQSLCSSRIAVYSVRQLNRTNWDTFILVYLRHSENIPLWEVGDAGQVLLRVNLECHIHMRTIKAKDKKYSIFFFLNF